MRKIQTCPCCEHYDTCKYWETLQNIPIADAVEFTNDSDFRKWKTLFARWCIFFKMDESTVDYLVDVGLDFVYHSSLEKVCD